MQGLMLILGIVFLGGQVNAACYKFWSGDTLPISNSSSYCLNIIRWPVSDQVLATYTTRDTNAIAYYTQIYNDFYLPNVVDKECLGMIQYMACAQAYPTCDGDRHTIESVCTWLCDLMPIRCGYHSNLYGDACFGGTATQKNCSYEGQLTVTLGALFLLSVLLL